MARSAESKARALRYARERRAWLKANGFCVTCGSNYNEPGYVLCSNCRKRDIARHKRTDPDGEKKRDSVRKLRADRKAAGLCRDCGGRLDGKSIALCVKCNAKKAERDKMYEMRKRLFQIPIVGISTK